MLVAELPAVFMSGHIPSMPVPWLACAVKAGLPSNVSAQSTRPTVSSKASRTEVSLPLGMAFSTAVREVREPLMSARARPVPPERGNCALNVSAVRCPAV